MSQNDDRKVRFNCIKSGVYTFEAQLDDTFFESIENDEIRGGKVHFDITIERNERVTMLTFAFDGEVRTMCDRCLGDMTVGVSGTEQLNVRFSDTETSDDEQVVVLPVETSELDLTPWMYEYVAVRMPIQHTHPDGECDPEMVRYIVEEEEQGHDEEYTDPRWDALKELK